MKKLFSLAFLFCALSAFGQQGTAIRAQGGIGTNTSFTGVGMTNIGPMTWRLGAGALGSTLSVADTNGLFRFIIAGPAIAFRDTNIIRFQINGDGVSTFWDQLGTDQLTITTNGLFGNGAGLTNLAGLSNVNVTVNFNGKVTINSLAFPTNTWAGPTNTLNLGTNYQFFVASTDCAITGIGGVLAGLNTWATLTVSNSTAADITVRSLASGIRPQGPNTLAALVIGAGKEGYLTYHARELRSTNYVTTTQQ